MNKLAQLLSNILQPVFFPTYSLILLFQVGKFSFLDIQHKVYIVASVFILTAFLPLIVLLVLKKLGLITSIQLPTRRERTIPYLFVVVLYIATVIFLYRIFMPLYIVSLMTGVVVSTIIIMLVNFKWKISAHLSALGGLCAAIIIVSYRLNINPSLILSIAFILSGLLAAARITLKMHTLLQTIFGFLTGFAVLLVFGSLF